MTDTPTKKLYIKTWGCQMNVYDSHRMADVLKPLGYTPTETVEDADFVILNTCHIREKATEKVFSELGRIKKQIDQRDHARSLSEAANKTLIAVAGCVAQAEGDVITARAPYVDMVFGPQTYHELPEMVLSATGQLGRSRLINTEFPADAKFDFLPQENASQGPVGMLAVQEGCDKFCTFCVVPYTRGAEYSRPVQQIVEEAKRLVECGAREIQLLGQNVNAYHGEGKNGQTASLADLIAEVAEVDGVARIRYTTSHPRDMSQDLIDAHRDVAKLMPFLHLPVQSGSDAILKTMNRKHTRDLYFDIVERLRKARPDLALSSDFIVGFPGESEEDHEATMDLVRSVGYASAYSFKYSPRPGTPGAAMKGHLPEPIKTRRLAELQALINSQQLSFNQSFKGQIVPVLFERKGKEDGQLVGRAPHMQSVYAEGKSRLIGHIVPVRILHGGPNSLRGEIVQYETRQAA